MNEILNYYKELVPFLGTALGSHFEVALLDCKTQKLIAIANGHVSGRDVGAPMTDLAEKMIAQENWREKDYVANYSGYAENNKLLRSSTYFIKSQGELLGMLCINMDTTEFKTISDTLLQLAGLARAPMKVDSENHADSETFQNSVPKTIEHVLTEIYGTNVPSHFSRDDRAAILCALQEKRLFLIKGAVSYVAKLFGCSVSTVYRELAQHPMEETTA